MKASQNKKAKIYSNGYDDNFVEYSDNGFIEDNKYLKQGCQKKDIEIYLELSTN